MPVDIRCIDQTGTSWGQQARRAKKRSNDTSDAQRTAEWVMSLENNS